MSGHSHSELCPAPGNSSSTLYLCRLANPGPFLYTQSCTVWCVVAAQPGSTAPSVLSPVSSLCSLSLLKSIHCRTGHVLFSRSPVDRLSGCADVFSSRPCLSRNGIAGSLDDSMFNLLKKCQTVPKVAAWFTSPV